MREPKALERSLITFVKSCDTSCAGGPGPECVIGDTLPKSVFVKKRIGLMKRR
jgi:hypothetical protein